MCSISCGVGWCCCKEGAEKVKIYKGRNHREGQLSFYCWFVQSELSLVKHGQK